MGTTRILFFLWILLMTFPCNWLSPGDKVQNESQAYFPVADSLGGWRKNTDADFVTSLGIDPQKLEEFGKWNVINDWGGNSLMHKSCIVIKNGWIIGEWYADKDGKLISVEEGKNKKARLASNSKSIAMTLFGVAVKDSKEGILSQKITLQSKLYDKAWLPEGFPLSDPRKERITFDNVFRHTSGILPEIQGIKDRGEGRNSIAFTTGRHPQFHESTKLNYNPGHPEEFFPKSTYSSVAFAHMPVVFKNIYGIPAYQVLENSLFNPIGISDVAYAPDIYDSYANWLDDDIRWMGYSGLWLTAMDYARFAYLLSHDGNWNGQQITQKGWIEQFRKSGEYPNMCGNVEGLWTSGATKQVGNRILKSKYPRDMVRLSGSGMNKAFIFPSQDMIVIRTSRIYPNTIWDKKEEEFLAKLWDTFIPDTVLIQENSLPGQIIQNPDDPGSLVYNRDIDMDSILDPFFLCGAGSPEGFLYRGKRNSDGTRDGDQEDMINKMIQHGGNGIYFISVRTHGGDAWKDKSKKPTIYPDDMHNPWTGQKPENGLNEAMLDQWENWFKLMDEHGIVIYFFIYDDAINIAKQFGWSLDDNGDLHGEEKKFVQALVKRFKHHKHLIWVVMEEGQELGQDWQLHVSKIAEAIAEVDDNNHIIASHQLGGNVFYHGNDPNISQFALQTDQGNIESITDLHQWMLKARENSNGRYNLIMAEDYVHGNISTPNHDREEIRKRSWGAAMVGSYVMVYGMNIADSPETWLHDCRTLQTFFESTTYNLMVPADSLASGETNYILANENYDYILYGSNAKNDLGVKGMTHGAYSLLWLDCISGEKKYIYEKIINDTNADFTIPDGFGDEVALYIRREDKRPANIKKSNSRIVINKSQTNRPPRIKDFSIYVISGIQKYIQLIFDDPDGGPGPYTIEIVDGPHHGTLTGNGNDRYYSPEPGFKGKDSFSWRVNDGENDSEISNVGIMVE